MQALSIHIVYLYGLVCNKLYFTLIGYIHSFIFIDKWKCPVHPERPDYIKLTLCPSKME